MYPRRVPQSPPLLLPVLVSMALGGCATKEFVQQEMGAVNQRIDALSGRLATAYQRIDGNALLILDSDKRIAAAEQSAAALGQRIDATQTGLTDAGRHIEAISADLNAATRRIDANSAEIARTHQRIDAIDERITSAQKQVQGTLGHITTAESRIGTLEGTLNTLGQGGGIASPPPVAAESRPVSETASAAPVEPTPSLEPSRRLDEIAAQIAAASQRIDSNISALSVAAERVGKVEASLADTTRRVAGSEANLAAAGQRIGEVQGQLASSEQRITANTEAIAVATQRVDTLHTSLDTTIAKVNAGEQAMAASNLRIDQAEAGLKQQSERMARNEAEDSNISITAKEALERATAAGKLAEGKLVYETVLSEERAGFAPYKTSLTDADKQALKQFADKLIAENRNVFLEIQGYSDNSGPAATNLRLSRERANNVRAFLHVVGGIPLHRMSVAAYGEASPVADNTTREGRGKNRRVVIVVLK